MVTNRKTRVRRRGHTQTTEKEFAAYSAGDEPVPISLDLERRGRQCEWIANASKIHGTIAPPRANVSNRFDNDNRYHSRSDSFDSGYGDSNHRNHYSWVYSEANQILYNSQRKRASLCPFSRWNSIFLIIYKLPSCSNYLLYLRFNFPVMVAITATSTTVSPWWWPWHGTDGDGSIYDNDYDRSCSSSFDSGFSNCNRNRNEYS